MQAIINNLLNYDYVREHLQMRICDFEDNQDWLKDKAMTRFGDFAAYYAVILSENTDGFSSAVILNSLLDVWEINVSTLHLDAVTAEMQQEPMLFSLNEIADGGWTDSENYLTDHEYNGVSDGVGFGLTNKMRTMGASLILIPNIRRRIGNFFNSDFYILPSSVHEVIVLPADDDVSIDELKTHVQTVNKQIVSPKDRLSDRVQIYHRSTGLMENAEEYEQRKKQGGLV